MTLDNHAETGDWTKDGYYVSKPRWQSYVDFHNRENSDEFLGYLDATRGIVAKLDVALLENEPEKLKSVIAEIVQNRKDLIEHAEDIMDNELSGIKYHSKPV